MNLISLRYITAFLFVFMLGCTGDKGILNGYLGTEGGGSTGGSTTPSNAVIMIPTSPVMTLSEGSTVKVIVQLNKPLPRPVTMNWEIPNGEKDFEVSSGVFTVSVDAESFEFEIKTKTDNLYEGDEKFFLKISGDVNVFLSPLSIPVVIQEAGAPLMVSVFGPGTPGVSQQTLQEKSGTPSETNIYIRLSAAADFTTQVKFTLTGTANQGADYTISESGSVTFGPGEVEKVINFRVVNDSLGEPAENFILTLTDIPVGKATIDPDNKTHTINIIDDDLAGAFFIKGVVGGADTKEDIYLTDGLVPTISWTNVLDEEEYKILVKSASGGAIVCSEVTVPADTLSYTFDPAHCRDPMNNPYTFVQEQSYRVEARVKVGGVYSAASNSGVFTFVVDANPPDPFLILGALGGVDREPDEFLAGTLYPSIVWQNTAGESGYRVSIHAKNGGAEVCAPVTVPANVTAYYFYNCELMRGSFYIAKVEALDPAMNVRAATNNDFEFFVTEVPSGYVVKGITGGTGDLTADANLNDAGSINPATTTFDPFAFKAEWEGSSGIDHYEAVILNLNNTVKCPKISTSTASATFYGCRLDLNIQYRLQVIGFDTNGIQYPASNSPYVFIYKRGLYLSADPSYPSYYRGIPISTCGGTAKCDKDNPYIVYASFAEDQVVIDKGAYMSAPSWVSGDVDSGNGRISIEVDYLRIENNGVLTMSGKGAPGSFGGGPSNQGAGADSGGVGTGGAYGGNGSVDAAGSNQAKAYGSPKNPMDLGSGGGNASGATGGSGGGSIVLKVNQELSFNSGTIETNGLTGGLNTGGGSGGSLHLTAKKISGVGGKLKANGGVGNGTGGPGSGGRIALYYEQITHAGGLYGIALESLPGAQGGASGTIFYKNTKTVGGDTHGYLMTDMGAYSQKVGVETPIPLEVVGEPTAHLFDRIITKNQGTFIIETGKTYTLQSSAATPTLDYRLVLAGDLLMPTGADFQIGSGGYLEWRKTTPLNQFNNLTIAGGGVLTHSPNLNARNYYLDISVLNNLTVFGSINVNGKGYGPTYGLGKSTSVGGASFGGQGGYTASVAERGTTYGKIISPDDLGSGSTAAFGGGQVKINVPNDFTFSGSISANGGDGCGGGSGGAIWITAKNVTGSGGSMSSQGGGSSSGSCGGGGGGRIAIYYQNTNYPGGITGIDYLVAGGDASTDGAAGTVYHKKNGVDTLGHLLVLNSVRDYNEQVTTPLRKADNPEQFNSIVTDSRGILLITSDFTGVDPYVLPSNIISYRMIAQGDFALPSGADLTIGDGGYLEVRRNTAYTFNSLTITPNGMLTHTSNTNSRANLIYFNLVNLNLDGIIDVSGRGYSGGCGPAGCTPGNLGVPTTFENGAGHGGYGGGRGLYQTTVGGAPYNELNIKAPEEFGSSGLPFTSSTITYRGSAGGGAVRFNVSNDFNFKGQILANGNGGVCNTDSTPICNGGGAGGSIFVTATNVKGVNGTLSAMGGNGGGTSTAAGSGGRIALIFNSDTSYAEGSVRKLLSYEKIRAFGGTLNNMFAGAAGSIFIKSSAGTVVNTNGDLIYNNGNNPHPQKTETLFPSVTYDSIQTVGKATLLIGATDTATLPTNLTYRVVGEGVITLPANLTIKNGGYLEWRKNDPINLTNLTIEAGGQLTHSYNYTTDTYRLDLNITGNLQLNGGGSIDVSERGFKPGYGRTGVVTGSGAYGGMSGTKNLPFGNYADPTHLGDAGSGKSSGGAVRIQVGGTTTLNGVIFANGGGGANGPGAGGSIKIDTGALTGVTGSVRANGGSGDSGASGGRIAIFYNTDSYPISYLIMTAYGGGGSPSGAAGTIFYKDKDSGELGHLIVNNTGQTLDPNITTTLPTDTLTSVTVDRNSAVEVLPGETVQLPTSSVGYRLIVGGTLKLPPTEDTLTIENNGVLELRTLDTFGSKSFAPATGFIRNLKVKPLGKITHSPNPAGSGPLWNPTYRISLDLDLLELQGTVDATGRGFVGNGGPCGNMDGACHGGSSGLGVEASTIYGSITDPQTLGSGAAPTSYGAGGGGLVKLDVNTLRLFGTIQADGGRIESKFVGEGGSSGGSINIKAVTLEGGGGRIYARGNVSTSTTCGGGGGRIALDVTTDAYNGGADSIAILANGGSSSSTCNSRPGAAGTIYMKGPWGAAGALIDRLVLNNATMPYVEGSETVINETRTYNQVVVGSSTTGIYVPAGKIFEPLSSNVFYPLRLVGDVKFPNATVSALFDPATDNWGDVTIQDGGQIIFTRDQNFSVESTRYIFRKFVMESGSKVTHTPNSDQAKIKAVNILTRDLFHMKSDSLIDVNGRGYPADKGLGAGRHIAKTIDNGINYPDAIGGSGGSYGGVGGGNIIYLNGAVVPLPTTGYVAPARAVYGVEANPLYPGSGGGGTYAGPGGGLVVITSQNQMTLEGRINADGSDGRRACYSSCSGNNRGDGGGSGGAINLTTSALSGAYANLSATGGNAGEVNYREGGAAGGGGRIAVKYTTSTYAGTISKDVSGGVAFVDTGTSWNNTDDTTKARTLYYVNPDPLQVTIRQGTVGTYYEGP